MSAALDTRGLKRICTGCATHFYDFNKRPITCPSCGVEFTGEMKVKSRRGRTSATEKIEESKQAAADTSVDAEDLDDEEDEEDDGVEEIMIDDDSTTLESTDDDTGPANIDDVDVDDDLNDGDDDISLGDLEDTEEDIDDDE